MTCLSVLTCARYADGALTPDEAAVVERHTLECGDCRQRVALLAEETHALRIALRAAEMPCEVPAFTPPASLAALLGWTLAAAFGLSGVWKAATAADLPGWLAWLVPDALGVGIDLSVATLRLMFTGDPVAALGGPVMWLALAVEVVELVCGRL